MTYFLKVESLGASFFKLKFFMDLLPSDPKFDGFYYNFFPYIFIQNFKSNYNLVFEKL